MTSRPSITSSLVDRIKDRFNNRVVKIRRNPYRFARTVATFIGVAGCAWVVFHTLQPGLIFTDTTATGGDTGAHVWWPAFMRDFLLKDGRLFGWSMDNYSGFPAGQYYFPVPAIMVVIFDIFLPYNIAFKLVTAIGSVAFAISAYVLGRSVKAPKPIPLLMAFAATAFLFFTGDPRGGSSSGSTTSTILNYGSANFNHRIMGGPLLSEMAGEFSFSIALSFGLLFLGAFFVMLREGKRRSLVAVLLALTVMSHLVVAIFVGLAAFVFWGASYAARRGFFRWLGYAMLVWICLFAVCIGSVGRYFFDHEVDSGLYVIFVITAGFIGLVIYGVIKHRAQMTHVAREAFPLLVAFLISSIWLIPLLARFQYTSNMRYEKLMDLSTTPGVNEVYELYLAPHYFLWPVFIPAAIGFILSATFLRKSIVPLVITAGIMGVVFVKWPEGHAWNLRFLPFWYIFLFFIAAVGYGELFRLPSILLSRVAYRYKDRKMLQTVRVFRTGTIVLLVVAFFVLLVGVGSVPKEANGCPKAEDSRTFPDRRGIASGWASYNYEGYERKPPVQEVCGHDENGKPNPQPKPNYTASKEFKSLMDQMATLPAGRALWEPSEGPYGTTLALTLLPYYTDHRIASQEGLYYEAAGSTAYHFLTVAEVSKTPSNPMRWPKCETKLDGTKKDPQCFDSYYGTLADFNRGVAHMQMMGVKYFLAHSDEAKEAADKEKDLVQIATVKDKDGRNPLGWTIYRINNAAVVEAVAHDPIVITDKSDPADWSQSGNKWLYDWFNAVGEYPLFVDDGPASWKRETAKQALADPMSKSLQKKKATVKVSDIKVTQDSVSFHVDKIGEPVIVKVSYYPTFQASGAKEIYRASPNFMVVVPTSKDVTISIERDSVEWISNFAFLIGIVLCIAMALAPRLSKKKKFKYLSALEGPKR